jgi:hypothetical protein
MVCQSCHQLCVEVHICRGRFLGYAGISMILTIPCFFLSAVAAYRIFRVHLVQRRLSKLTITPSYSLSAERAANTTKFANSPSSPRMLGVHSMSEEDDSDDKDCDVMVMPRNYMPHVGGVVADAEATLPVDDICSPRCHSVPSSSSSPSRMYSTETRRWDKSRINTGGRLSTAPIDNTIASLPISGESSRPCL